MEGLGYVSRRRSVLRLQNSMGERLYLLDLITLRLALAVNGVCRSAFSLARWILHDVLLRVNIETPSNIKRWEEDINE